MTFAIPAQPGTTLIHKDDRLTSLIHKDDRREYVVVGWLVTAFGRAIPVTLNPVGNLADYEVRHPVGDEAAYEPVPAFASAAPAEDKVPVWTKPSRAAESRPEPAPRASGPISFTGKTYLRKTFWLIAGHGLLVMPPDSMTPEGEGVTKITRDRWVELRKTNPETTVIAIQSSSPAAEDEDDDADDLI